VTVEQFRHWLKGFLDGTGGALTAEQVARVLTELAKVQESIDWSKLMTTPVPAAPTVPPCAPWPLTYPWYVGDGVPNPYTITSDNTGGLAFTSAVGL
jgi:hypothetical protein